MNRGSARICARLISEQPPVRISIVSAACDGNLEGRMELKNLTLGL